MVFTVFIGYHFLWPHLLWTCGRFCETMPQTNNDTYTLPWRRWFHPSQSGSFLTAISAWKSNYIHYKMWDEIAGSLSTFNHATVAVWEVISDWSYTLVVMWLLIHTGVKVKPCPLIKPMKSRNESRILQPTTQCIQLDFIWRVLSRLTVIYMHECATVAANVAMIR